MGRIMELISTLYAIYDINHARYLFLERAYLMLTTWCKQEGEAATKEEMIYVLDGLVASKVISKATYEEAFN